MIVRPLSRQSAALTAAVALLVSAFLVLARSPVMIVDGQRLVSDVAPVTTANDRVFVPIRTLADALGAQTVLDAKGAGVDVVRGSATLHLRIGSRHATLNGMPMTLVHPPFRVRGRTMVPLKLLTHAFGVRATYDSRRDRIEILTPGVGRIPTPSTATE